LIGQTDICARDNTTWITYSDVLDGEFGLCTRLDFNECAVD